MGTPIVTYWAGPGPSSLPINDQTVAQLRAAGYNMGWAGNAEDLDVYYRNGVRAMLVIHTPDVNDQDQANSLDALIARVREHPAMYAYFLTDEPGAGAFPKLGKLVAYLRKRDPAHPAYINLLPTYASVDQLQVSDDAAERAKVGYPQDFAGIATSDQTAIRYREHLRQFIETVHPSLLSYDHYHFMKNSDGEQYFLNLSLVRAAAIKAGIPFLNIIQTCDSPSEGWRGPSADEVRWLTYTSLAYGAHGICHFRYDTGLFKDPKEATQPLPLYWEVSEINREFIAIATELQPLKSLGAYHCRTVSIGGQALPADAPFKPEPTSQDVLIGYFGKRDKPTHVVVVNLDYHNPAAVTLVGPGSMQVFHAPTQSWSATSASAQVKLDLPPGGGALVRVK